MTVVNDVASKNPGILLSFILLFNLATDQLQMLCLPDGHKLLCLSWCFWCSLSFALEGPLGGLCAQRHSVLHRQELARTTRHYLDKNNRNLVRNQRIWFLFIALVATKCDMNIWGSFLFRFYIKQLSEERVYKYYFFVPLALHLYVS